MDLSIIILNYRLRGLVRQCLRGILMAEPRASYEVIVVDNHSGDGCLEMCAAQFPWVVTVASDANRGFGAGNNLGIAKASGSAILVLNPDIALFPGQIDALLACLHTHPRAGIVGPQLCYPDGTTQDSCFRFPRLFSPLYRRTWVGRLPFARRELDRFLMRDYHRTVPQSVDWLMGACLLLRRAALNEVGRFDERFFMYFEDLDLCRRSWQLGWEVWYVPAARLVHYHQRQSAEHGGFSALWYPPARQHLRSALAYYRKYRGDPWPPASPSGQGAGAGVR